MGMKNSLKRVACVSCVILVSSSTFQAHAQNSNAVRKIPEVESKFRKALAAYESKQYRAALTKFEDLSNSQIIHQRMTASLLMMGKSLYKLGQFSNAISYFEKLIEKFPESRYVDDAYYGRATSNFRLNEYFKSVKDLLWVTDWGSRVLANKSKKLATQIMQSDLGLSELQDLLKFANGENSSALVTLQLSKKEILVGSSQRAISLLKDYKKKYGSSAYLPQIDQLLDEAEGFADRPIKVGVILPLTGYYGQEGLGVLRGIKYAQKQSQNDSDVPVQLVVRDSESNMIKAIKETKRLINDGNVRVVIGELESEVSASIGALASLEHVPVLAPAATENQVASVGESVFQLNSDLERKGEALAELAFKELELRTFATLAPADEYGLQMTASFTSKIDQLGGRIIAQRWYYGSPEDLSRQFKAIRDAAFHFDSTDVENIIRMAEEEGEELEERDIPVESIDGIFLPVYSDDIRYVAPQFALANIQAQILGGEYWDNIEILKESQVQRYVNGVIFVSDYFPDEESREFRDFRSDFRLKMRKTPERWEVFGYDAFSVIKEVINAGAKTGQEIAQRLSSLSEYKGLKGKISFKGNNRVNEEVNFLQFINGKIVKLE
jgi:branched-chain amino acid transport system substrate-binding protein